MLQLWLLRFHRWITLTLSIPLAVLIVTGLVLSFEPMVQQGTPAPVTADTLDAVLARHDPSGVARSLVIRSYAGMVSISGAQRSDAIHVDPASNERAASPGALAEAFTVSRRLHETFLLDLGWLVAASTIALLVLIAIGIAMGWPRLRNTVSGWHKGTGWFLLPLLILSPLTGLFLAFGLSFASPPPAPGASARPVPLREAVKLVAAEHDLGQVTWIRSMGPRLLVRLNDHGEMRVFAITSQGLAATSRNWPRLLHEGNWLGIVSALVNVVISIAFVGLLGTGLIIWARRRFRRRQRRPATA
jgi:uncharacterized iron-regulated membrane protein